MSELMVGAASSDTHQKALKINLDPRRYGTFAEIGAGQEVVRWFFRVGGAAGTIAKSMSAYDMAVSDAIYGECDRYVCRQRLRGDARPRARSSTSSRLRDEPRRHDRVLRVCRHGLGPQLPGHQRVPRLDGRAVPGPSPRRGQPDHPARADARHRNALQQEALGIVGVNLLYGAFFLNHEPDQLVESLLDNLTTRRIEIDMIEFSGIAFRARRQPGDEPASWCSWAVSGAAMFRPGPGGAATLRGAVQEGRSWSSAAASGP